MRFWQLISVFLTFVKPVKSFKTNLPDFYRTLVIALPGFGNDVTKVGYRRYQSVVAMQRKYVWLTEASILFLYKKKKGEKLGASILFCYFCTIKL